MLPRRALIFLGLAWILVMLYPDPGMLVRSVRNVARPQIEPQAVAALAARLPDDPRAVEAYVLGRQVPYAYDWQSAGVPWYFPTTAEAVSAGRGDCESRAVVLASILTAKGIPNDLRVGLGHIWVDYPGKEASVLENEAVQVAGVEDGRFFLRWPEELRLGEEISEQLAIHWTPAPAWRLVLLFAGLSLIVLWNALARVLAAGGLGPAGPPAVEPRSARRHGRSRREGGAPAASLRRARRVAPSQRS
ncbi:MAG TPA: transglutaminase domain-containing protein [Thermoleophilia bacterium]|nr:transglutaminase domain-containing protein [Thermoleophilia bacterium]